LALLKPYGVSLNQVAQDWIARRKAAEASITYEAAMDAFLESRKRSESYARSIRQTRNRLDFLHGKMLNTEIATTHTPCAMSQRQKKSPASLARSGLLRISVGLRSERLFPSYGPRLAGRDEPDVLRHLAFSSWARNG
jgi:ferric-dicitrate binding protein FerR (iron transport regulator)